MDIPKDWKPNRIREQLENVLMDLENEKSNLSLGV